MSIVAGPGVSRNSLSFYINAVTGGNTLSSVLTGNSLFVNGGSTITGVINPQYGSLVQSQLPLTSSSNFTIATSFNKNNSSGTLFEIRSGNDYYVSRGLITESSTLNTNPALSTVGYSPTYSVSGIITESKTIITKPATGTVGYSQTYGVSGITTDSVTPNTTPVLGSVGYSPTYVATEVTSESKISSSYPASGTDSVIDQPTQIIEIYTTVAGMVLRIRNNSIETNQEYAFIPSINDVVTLVSNGTVFTLYLNSTQVFTNENAFSLPNERITLFSRGGKSNFSSSQIRAVQILNTALSSGNIINNAEALRIRG